MPLLKDKEKRSRLRRQLYDKLDAEGETLELTLKTLRKILAMDQETFADFVGISVATLRKIEQKNGNVTLKIMQKILDKFSLELIVKAKKKN